MLHVHRWRVTIILLALVATSCSKEDLTGALEKAKTAVADGVTNPIETVKSTTEKVQEQLNLAGGMELTAGEPIKTEACYVSLIPQGEGRPTILQVQSYRDAGSESFPSVFLQAHVNANSIDELVGEPIPARLFIQRKSEGSVLFSDAATPIELKITAIEEQTISAELSGASLQDTSTRAAIPVTGSITGVLQ